MYHKRRLLGMAFLRKHPWAALKEYPSYDIVVAFLQRQALLTEECRRIAVAEGAAAGLWHQPQSLENLCVPFDGL